MSLTLTQLATLKTDVLAQPTLTAAVLAADWPTVALFYNAGSTPSANVWIPNLPATVLNGTVNWVAFAAKTVQQQNTYFAMVQGGFVDATSANIRAGFGAVFSGADLTALANIAQQVGTRFEVLFSTANVSLVFGQTLDPADVQKAMA